MNDMKITGGPHNSKRETCHFERKRIRRKSKKQLLEVTLKGEQDFKHPVGSGYST
jgi:hypothetical protein